MIARADLELHAPILLSEEQDGAPDTLIVSGIASASELLDYPDGTDEVTDQARADTAAGLVGVPIVSPEEHQRWAEAINAGRTYDVQALGTVIDAALEGDGVRYRAAIHDRDAQRRIRPDSRGRREWPAVSVGYHPRYGASQRADRAQVRRVVNHLALVPRGRDPLALIRADAADGVPMTPEEIKALAAELAAAIMPALADAMKPKEAPAAPELPPEAKAEMDAAKADAAACKARADAAEAKLSAIEAEKRKARGTILGAALAKNGIKVEGYDLARADAADIAAAERALLDATLIARADADPLAPSGQRIASQPNTGEAKPTLPRIY